MYFLDYRSANWTEYQPLQYELKTCEDFLNHNGAKQITDKMVSKLIENLNVFSNLFCTRHRYCFHLYWISKFYK